eukprot:scaffold5635_cov120-Isochrysis_galbana.AAC.5
MRAFHTHRGAPHGVLACARSHALQQGEGGWRMRCSSAPGVMNARLAFPPPPSRPPPCNLYGT